MNTISFSNAFKSLMATLGAKTTDSNYAVPLVNKTSGAPQGFMDMSNLASVLGETESISVWSGSLNTCNEIGKKYFVPASFTDVSDRPTTGVTLLVFVIGIPSIRYQIAFNAMGGMAYIRTNNVPDHTEWNSWYSFELTTLT